MHARYDLPVHDSANLDELLRASPVRVVFGPGALAQLGTLCRELRAQRVLLVSDPGIVAAGHVARAMQYLEAEGIRIAVFDGAHENPTTEHVAAGLDTARQAEPDLIVGLGGGSAMDCAKGVNLLLTNGGQMSDYRGDPPADVLARRKPLLPMLLIPTTAGTGSEAQSFALISDAATNRKMACGDRRLPREGGLRPHVAILDPDLLVTQPREIAAHAGIDALAHAVETAGSTRRNERSRALSCAAWRALSGAFPRAMADPRDRRSWAAMLAGAHLAGAAIELSMLGAAHACANPLTQRFGVAHGVAVGLMLPHVVRFNAAGGENPYSDLDADAESLVGKIEALLVAAGAPQVLVEIGVPESALDDLAALAAQEWTATFNPRRVGAAALREIYTAATR
ncbi:MAG: iron-containing alcohol dehydrogenase [Phycisphaerae bacterium]